MPTNPTQNYRALPEDIFNIESVKNNKRIRDFLEGTIGRSGGLFKNPKNPDISDETKASLTEIFLARISKQPKPENLEQDELNSLYVASIFESIKQATTTESADDKIAIELKGLLNIVYNEQQAPKQTLIKVEKENKEVYFFTAPSVDKPEIRQKEASTLGVLAKGTEVTFNASNLTTAAAAEQKAFYYALFDAASIKEFEQGRDGSVQLKKAL